MLCERAFSGYRYQARPFPRFSNVGSCVRVAFSMDQHPLSAVCRRLHFDLDRFTVLRCPFPAVFSRHYPSLSRTILEFLALELIVNFVSIACLLAFFLRFTALIHVYAFRNARPLFEAASSIPLHIVTRATLNPVSFTHSPLP